MKRGFTRVAVHAALALLAMCALPAVADVPTPRVDELGDSLPDHALFRIGTTRLQHVGEVRGLAISRDGRFLASHGQDRMIRVWDARDGKPLWSAELKSWRHWALAFSHDGKELAAIARSDVSEVGSFRRWNIKTGRDISDGNGIGDANVQFTYPGALVCREDGKYLAAETSEQDIALYLPGVLNSRRILKGHTGRVMSLCFTGDGKRLVSLGDEGAIRLWNTADGKETATLPAPKLEKHELKGNLAFIAIAPDGKKLAVSLPDNSTRILDASGRELHRIEFAEQVNALAFSPDGKALLTGGSLVESWNVENAEPIALINQPRRPIQFLTLSSDGHIAAFAENKDHLRLVDVVTGKTLLHRPFPCRAGIAFSPAGGLLAASPADNTIGFWNVAALLKDKPAQPSVTLRCQGKVSSFVFSPDGKRLATIEDGNTSRIYDAASQKCLASIKPPGRSVYAVAFSADGKLLATMGERDPEGGAQVMRLWHSDSAKEAPIGGDLRQLAHTIVFHPDTQTLAALQLPSVARNSLRLGSDRDLVMPPVEDRMESVRLWSVEEGREKIRFEDSVQRKLAELEGGWVIGRSEAVAGAFSPDGRLFATPGPGGIVVFETASGLPRLRLSGHLQKITGLAFTPDGRTLVSASSDSTLLIWDVTGLRTGVKPAGATDELWRMLADSDAETAGRALWAMVASPTESVAFVRRRLHPVSVSQDDLRKLVAELDDAKFSVRDKAMRELAALGRIAEAALTKQLKTGPSPEASRRIEELLTAMKAERLSTDQLRIVRAVEVLEKIDSNEARVLLGELARGAEGAILTRQASDAFKRLLQPSAEQPRHR